MPSSISVRAIRSSRSKFPVAQDFSQVERSSPHGDHGQLIIVVDPHDLRPAGRWARTW